MNIEDIKFLDEKNDKVEFKEAKGGTYSFNGGSKVDIKERRKCIIGYIVAFANEEGGRLIFGVKDKKPHEIVGTTQNLGTLGQLEENIYRELKIRVTLEELYDEHNKRILVIHIPRRPIGKVLKFEDVPLMRIGEELLPMSDEQYLKIIQEQEPDFSATLCKGLKLEDLDENAIQIMKESFSKKQNNPIFLTLNNDQILSDLDLIKDSKLTYAALILLGKPEKIKAYLPQCAVFLEFRNDEYSIPFSKRDIFQVPYFLMIEKLWNQINTRNQSIPVEKNMYIFDIPLFNSEVIREAINNAVAHRDYRKQSEIVIKQSPTSLIVSNPGGFPLGVNLNNLLTVCSTPRNRLLTEVLLKTGIVERSGQGIDKIFYKCLAEAKGLPDYSSSDDFDVHLKIPSVVKDKAFVLFIEQIQKRKTDGNKLSVQEILTLEKIREKADKTDLDLQIIDLLYRKGLIEKVGKTRKLSYILSKEYYSFSDQEGKYSQDSPIDEKQALLHIIHHFDKFEIAKMNDFIQLLDKFLTRDQVKRYVYKLTEAGMLKQIGTGAATRYKLNKSAKFDDKFINRALKLGFEEMRKRGEIT
jgi:ATP-dependent DNA helicase RecG